MRAWLTLCAALVLAAFAAPAAAFYAEKGAVRVLTPDNFNKYVMESNGVWLVEFYAPWCGHCKALTPEWQQAAKTLKGIVHLGAVDADEHKSLGSKYNVEGFPTIKVFGDDKSAPTEYDGGRKASDIVAAALKHAKAMVYGRLGVKADSGDDKKDAPPPPPPSGFYENSDVIEATDATWKEEVEDFQGGALVEFYAPWCGHCKNMIPSWKAAAEQLEGVIKMVAVDATAQKEIGNKYNVQGFPTIKFFPPEGEPEDYNGGRSTEAFVEFGTAKGEEFPWPGAKGASIQQIEDDDSLKKNCLDKKLMCVVFFVPHVIETAAEGRNKLLEMFNAVTKKLKSKVASVWAVGGEHEKFEEGVGIYQSYPTFVAINGKNLRYVTHRGGFDQAAIETNLRKILDGKMGTATLKALPKLSKGVEPWDGKDYVEPSDDE